MRSTDPGFGYSEVGSEMQSPEEEETREQLAGPKKDRRHPARIYCTALQRKCILFSFYKFEKSNLQRLKESRSFISRNRSIENQSVSGCATVCAGALDPSPPWPISLAAMAESLND
jgi:hypothetical protein